MKKRLLIGVILCISFSNLLVSRKVYATDGLGKSIEELKGDLTEEEKYNATPLEERTEDSVSKLKEDLTSEDIENGTPLNERVESKSGEPSKEVLKRIDNLTSEDKVEATTFSERNNKNKEELPKTNEVNGVGFFFAGLCLVIISLKMKNKNRRENI